MTKADIKTVLKHFAKKVLLAMVKISGWLKIGWQKFLKASKPAKVVIIFAGVLLLSPLVIFLTTSPVFKSQETRNRNGKNNYEAALLSLSKDDLTSSEKFLKTAIANSPQNYGYVWQLALVQEKNNKYQEAIKTFEILQKQIPDKTLVYIQEGELYEKIGDQQKAKEHYLNAIKIDKHFISSYLKLSDLFKAQGNSQESYSVLQQGLRMNPGSEEIKSAINSFDHK